MSRLDDVSEGEQLSPVEKDITVSQLFRFSAVTWNPHRIHYDPEWARSEGHPDVLVQAHLHGAVVQELLFDWLDEDGELSELAWQNVGRATPADTLVAEAEVREIDVTSGVVAFDVWTHTDEERCANGTATVEITE